MEGLRSRSAENNVADDQANDREDLPPEEVQVNDDTVNTDDFYEPNASASEGDVSLSRSHLPITTFASRPGTAMGVIPYGTREGNSFHDAAIKRLETKFDLNASGLTLFLQEVQHRAALFYWVPNFNVPTLTGLMYFFANYGRITLSTVQSYAKTYLGKQTRKFQNALMIHSFLYGSLTDSAKLRVNTKTNDWRLKITSSTGIVRFYEDGLCLLKTILSLTEVQTPFTTISIRRKFMQLGDLMAHVDSNIQTFHEKVHELETKLLSTGNQIEDTDLMVHLNNAYATVPDEEFTKYMKLRWDEYLEGLRTMDAKTLRDLAENKYKVLSEESKWKQPSDAQRRIVALEAAVMDAKAAVRDANERTELQLKAFNASKQTEKKTSNRDKNGIQRWKLKEPKDGESHQMVRKGNTYHWCPFHASWTAHKPDECRQNPQVKKDGADKDNSPPSGLKAAAACLEVDDNGWDF